MEKEKEFIKQILTIRDYWLKAGKGNAKETVDGFIHSLLVMFDGDSGVNDFQSIILVKESTQEMINANYPLHEVFHMENN